jgi:hypothetical protein
MFNNYNKHQQEKRHNNNNNNNIKLHQATSELNPIAIQCDDLSLDYLQLDAIDRVVFRVAG